MISGDRGEMLVNRHVFGFKNLAGSVTCLSVMFV